jgi:Protein of unknown function (DUF1353)
MNFEGEVRTEWLREPGDDRTMRVLTEFAFVDSTGHRWTAMPGDAVNGASIPQMLWSVAGSPFIGDYRRASVLHDVACQKRERPSKEVHRMFYEAMKADGVDESTALKFYTAVRLFGPSWTIGADGRIRVFTADAAPLPNLRFEDVEQALDVVLAERH